VTETIQLAIPEDLSPNDIGDFVAPLDETQIRSLLIDNLRTDALSSQQTSLETAPTMLQLLKGIGDPDSESGGGITNLAYSSTTYFSIILLMPLRR